MQPTGAQSTTPGTVAAPDAALRDAALRDATLRDATPGVAGRAFVLGLLLSSGMAGLNCWIETLLNVHFLGGVQMPFGAVFVLLFLILAINLPLRALHQRRTPRAPAAAHLFIPFSPVYPFLAG